MKFLNNIYEHFLYRAKGYGISFLYISVRWLANMSKELSWNQSTVAREKRFWGTYKLLT
jgi:hypothetical protein